MVPRVRLVLLSYREMLVDCRHMCDGAVDFRPVDMAYCLLFICVGLASAQ